MAPRTVASIRAGAKSVIPLFFQQYSKNNGCALLTAFGGAFGGGGAAAGGAAGGAFGGEAVALGGGDAVALGGGDAATTGAGGFTSATTRSPRFFSFRRRGTSRMIKLT